MNQGHQSADDEPDRYFIRVQGKILGPFSTEKLQSLRARGQFSRAHEVSTDRYSWKPASTLDSLFAQPAQKVARTAPDPDPPNSFSLQTLATPAPAVPAPAVAAMAIGPAANWHYNALGQQLGPVSIIELRNLIVTGTLSPEDFVFKEGMSDWVRISEAPELQGMVPNSKSPAVSKAKDATKDALQALLTIATNPVGGLSDAFQGLGEQRALGVGLVFAALFAVCQLFVTNRILAGARIRPNELWILVYALVPFVSLVGVCFMLRMAFRGDGSLAHDCFLAGTALLPTGAASVLASILGAANIEVILVIIFSAFCLTILMLYAGLTKLSRFSERLASIAVPLMLLAAGWLCKILYATLLKDQLNSVNQSGLF